MQSRHERLEQPHQEVEREVLAAVRVSGQLQVEAGVAGRERAPRLVGEQHPHIARRRAAQGGCGIGRHRQIGDAGEQQPRAAAPHHLIQVLQDRQAQPLHLAAPAGRVPVVLVVSRDVELAEPGREPAQRRDLVLQVRHEPVRHVARERDHVGVEGVGRRHHALDEAALQRRADMQVGELHDAKPVQGRR